MESKFGLRTKTSEHHWQQCEIKNLKVTKPLIICLSGNGTKTELEANGFCKLVENLIGDESQKIDLLGVSYGVKDEQHSKRGELSSKDVELLVDNILIPLCKDKKTGNILPMECCCKNLSLITFFTFCHGSLEVKNILEKFDERLKIMGLSKQDISNLIQSLFEINYAKETDDVSCPQISVSSMCDILGGVFGYWYFGDEDYDGKFKDRYAIVCDKPGQFCKKDWVRPESKRYGAITVMASSILNNSDNSDDDIFASIQSTEHNIGHFKSNENGLTPSLNENGKVLRNAMSISLQKRVENSLLNLNSQSYIPFYLQELNLYLENNLSQTNRIDNSVEQELCI